MRIENVTVGFTCSTFDLLHAGHVFMLEECKNHCDWLIVGLQTDPTIDRPDTKNKPAQSIVERFIQVRACAPVDEVIPYTTEQDLLDLLAALPINIRFIGEEYMGRDFTGKQFCMDKNISIFYNSRKHRFSTTDLRKRAAIG
jgi:glycerol-3-phosphate cytidylyltransferase